MNKDIQKDILEFEKKFGRWPDPSKITIRVILNPDNKDQVCVAILYADEVKYQTCIDVPAECTNILDGQELFSILGCTVYLDNTEVCLTRASGEVWAKAKILGQQVEQKITDFSVKYLKDPNPTN
ncbi:hypothetical protein [Bacillus thuringiensis]|uniref:hypothetical protein n=1 Tax=Bacillus thuringiensis TaxID=1428 RepID=UPI000BFBC672|nr:hypothetical protein [Bacillus thuringiensis]PGM44863.1 hypothetical protein CN949_30570 [Bacillus thuringiensis]